MKTDIHVHCPTPKEGQTNFDCARELRAFLESQSINKAILMSSGEHKRQIGLVGTNREIQEIANAMPDFYSWMCNLDPAEPERIYDRMALCKAQGAVGVGELVINRWLDDPVVQAVFAAAEKLCLPVTIHMSSEPGFLYGVCDRPGLPLLEGVLKAYPDLIVVAHSALFWLEISGDCPTEGNEARNAYGHGKVTSGGAVTRLMDTYKKLYCDLSATSGSTAIMRDKNFGLWFLETYQDRLLYATDSYDCQKIFPLGTFMDDALQCGKLSATAYQKIIHENAERLYYMKRK